MAARPNGKQTLGVNMIMPRDRIPATKLKYLHTVLTRVYHWSLTWARCIHSKTSQPISIESILTLPSLLCLGRLSSLFPLRLLTKVLYPFPMAYNLISLITFGEAYKLWSSSLCSLIQPPAATSPLRTLTSDILSLYFHPSVTTFHTHTKREVKIIVSYF